MRLAPFIWFLAVAFPMLGLDVHPSTPRQGEVIHVQSKTASARSARMGERTVPLFEGFALFPIPVKQKSGAYKLETLDSQGKVLDSASIQVREAHYPSQNIVLSRAIAQLKASPGEEEATAAFRQEVSAKRYWSEPLTAPVPGCLTSLFGVKRLQNGKPTGSFHTGVDLRGAAGSPVLAMAGGIVKIAQRYSLHGGTIAIDHGWGLESMYLHLSQFAVHEGAIVKGGDVIGFVGSTGRSTAPHLHWNIYANSVPVNPAQWVKLEPCPAKRVAPRRRRRA